MERPDKCILLRFQPVWRQVEMKFDLGTPHAETPEAPSTGAELFAGRLDTSGVLQGETFQVRAPDAGLLGGVSVPPQLLYLMPG